MTSSEQHIEKLIDLMRENNRDAVQFVFSDASLKILRNSIREAEEIWQDIYSELQEIEDGDELPIRLILNKKYYSLDMLLLTKALRINDSKSSVYSKLYLLYLVIAHMIDDYIEDYQKYKLHMRSMKENEAMFRSSIIQILFIVQRLFYSVIEKNTDILEIEAVDKLRLQIKFNEKLFITFTHALKEFSKNSDDPNEIF